MPAAEIPLDHAVYYVFYKVVDKPPESCLSCRSTP
jgi:hypothetical protein